MRGGDTFFDTNILLYLISEDITKADRAETLLGLGGVISVQVLNEFSAVALRKQAVSFTATIRAVCAVKPVDIETHELGLNLAERHRFSIYDGLIVAAALRAGCSLLYTEDLHDGQTVEQLTIRDPFTSR